MRTIIWNTLFFPQKFLYRYWRIFEDSLELIENNLSPTVVPCFHLRQEMQKWTNNDMNDAWRYYNFPHRRQTMYKWNATISHRNYNMALYTTWNYALHRQCETSNWGKRKNAASLRPWKMQVQVVIFLSCREAYPYSWWPDSSERTRRLPNFQPGQYIPRHRHRKLREWRGQSGRPLPWSGCRWSSLVRRRCGTTGRSVSGRRLRAPPTERSRPRIFPGLEDLGQKLVVLLRLWTQFHNRFIPSRNDMEALHNYHI